VSDYSLTPTQQFFMARTS